MQHWLSVAGALELDTHFQFASGNRSCKLQFTLHEHYIQRLFTVHVMNYRIGKTGCWPQMNPLALECNPPTRLHSSISSILYSKGHLIDQIEQNHYCFGLRRIYMRYNIMSESLQGYVWSAPEPCMDFSRKRLLVDRMEK